MNLQNEEYFKEIIHSYLSNGATEKEKEDLTTWIDKSDENKKQFLEYKRAWILTSQAVPKGVFNKAKYEEWNKISKKLSTGNKDVKPGNISLITKITRIAAIFLLLVSIASIGAWRITSKKLNDFLNMESIHQVSAPMGSKSEVILPDGTKVSLNAGSNISYTGNYGLTDRTVKLTGEGYFDVVTNPKIPFVVDASGLMIRALGTIFNVKAYPEDGTVTTTLVEGLVHIQGKGIDLTLTQRQKATYEKSVIPDEVKPEMPAKEIVRDKKETTTEAPRVKLTSNVNILEQTAWKDGRLVFNSESLGTLSVLLERQFNVSINIDSEELKNYKFTGTFHKETLEQILDILKLSAPIKYNIQKGIVRISIEEKRKHIFREVTK
jgi:transmembrane sensor